MVHQLSSIFIVDFPFNIDTKIPGEEAGKASNKAIKDEDSASKLQFKAAYDSVLKSDFATETGNNLPVAHDEIAGTSHLGDIALSKPGESQMVRLGDFDIEISGTSASLDDTVAFAQEIGLDRDLVETILLQSSTSEIVNFSSSSDPLSSPIAPGIVPSDEMEEAADAIVTLISKQLRLEVSSNIDSDLSSGQLGLGSVLTQAEIRSLIEGYIESKSNAGDNLNVQIALKKSDLGQSISAAIAAADVFQPGAPDRMLVASPEAHQNLKQVVLETLNLSPALDDVRQSLLVRAGQKVSSEDVLKSGALIPEFRQETSQLTAASAKDFLRGVSQDPIEGRHFLSKPNPELAFTRNTHDLISARGITRSLSEDDAIRSNKALKAEFNTGIGSSVKGYEPPVGSKPALDSLKVKAKASFLSANNSASSATTNHIISGRSVIRELSEGDAIRNGKPLETEKFNEGISKLVKGYELSGPRANIDQVTSQVIRRSDLGDSPALPRGDHKRSEESVLGDAVKAGLKNSVMDKSGASQKILRGGDLNSYVASGGNRIEPKPDNIADSIKHQVTTRIEPKPDNIADSIKHQVTTRIEFEARGELAKGETELRQVADNEYRAITKDPRVNREFDQRLSPSSGAEKSEVQKFSPLPGASDSESPKLSRSEVEGQFASSETNVKHRQSRVFHDRMPRRPEPGLVEDRVGELRSSDLGSRVEAASPNVAVSTRNPTSQSSKLVAARPSDSLLVEPTKDLLIKRELNHLSITEHRVAPQSIIDGGSTSPGLSASSGIGFGIESAISAGPTANSGPNLGERSAPLDSGALVKANGGPSPQSVPTREMVGENLSKLIGQRMLANVESGNYRINFNLFPRDMGMVDITMELRDGRLDAQINASNAVTRDLLGDTLPRLRDALNLSGFSGSNIELGSDQDRRSRDNSNSETSENGHDSDGKDLKNGGDGSRNIIVEDMHLDSDTVDLWA